MKHVFCRIKPQHYSVVFMFYLVSLIPKQKSSNRLSLVLFVCRWKRILYAFFLQLEWPSRQFLYFCMFDKERFLLRSCDVTLWGCGDAVMRWCIHLIFHRFRSFSPISALFSFMYHNKLNQNLWCKTLNVENYTKSGETLKRKIILSKPLYMYIVVNRMPE